MQFQELFYHRLIVIKLFTIAIPGISLRAILWKKDHVDVFNKKEKNVGQLAVCSVAGVLELNNASSLSLIKFNLFCIKTDHLHHASEMLQKWMHVKTTLKLIWFGLNILGEARITNF